ncbi:hypothetical protein CKY47_03790 [Saccharothrix yanglingensis]|uniref:Secreted protein n=1 Tax=Saccharothrix yanglingensis TaxID=659496 RepID=A0ABU0WTE6_9PSEU|nr:hypothetical protein [Saccharothrix yanglingensis]
MFGAIAVVAVLVGVVAGAHALWGVPLPASARNVPPTGEAGREAADRMAVADFQHGFESYDHVRTFADVVDLKFLGDSEVDAYREAGAGAARLTVASNRPEGQVLVTVVRVADEGAARRTATELDDQQLGFGMKRIGPEHGVDRIARVVRQDGATPPAVVRAHYAHDDLVVRVELNARSADRAEHFGDLLARQLGVLPADG